MGETKQSACRIVYDGIMDGLDDFGASDTEPRTILIQLLDHIYRNEDSVWDN
jgi:hypothetical protein